MRMISGLVGLLFLSACVPSQEACLRDATRDLRVVDRLIAEDRATLARGYALEREVVESPRVRLCTGIGSYGRVGVGVSTCNGPDRIRTRTVPQAVDLGDVRARLASLTAKRAELAATAERNSAACRMRPA